MSARGLTNDPSSTACADTLRLAADGKRLESVFAHPTSTAAFFISKGTREIAILGMLCPPSLDPFDLQLASNLPYALGASSSRISASCRWVRTAISRFSFSSNSAGNGYSDDLAEISHSINFPTRQIFADPRRSTALSLAIRGY
jgi:hypothetical protein